MDYDCLLDLPGFFCFALKQVVLRLVHLFLPRKFPGEKCNEVAGTSVYCHDNDSWPAHAPVCMWFDYGVLNDFLKEWVVRMDELKSGVITRDEYFEWKINWPYTCDDCGKYEPKKQWRKNF